MDILKHIHIIQDKYDICSTLHSDEDVYVIKATDKSTQQTVAIKVQPVDRKRNARSEIEMLTYVNEHIPSDKMQHLQTMLSCEVHPEVVVMVSKCYNDDSLRRNVSYSQSLRRRVMYQILTAVDQLHSIHVIHRDIKPSNILYDKETEHAVLCDFDLSVFDSDTASTSKCAGTDGFMAPEVLAHDQKYVTDNYTNKADVYSLGVVFACLLYHVSESDVEQFLHSRWKTKAKRNLKNKYSSAGSKEESDLLLNMLRFNADERLSAKQCLEHVYFSQIKAETTV